MKYFAFLIGLVFISSSCSKDNDTSASEGDSVLELAIDRDFSLLLYNGDNNPVANRLIVGTDTVVFAEEVTSLDIGSAHEVTYQGQDYILHKTALPIISLTTSDAIDPDVKGPGTIYLIEQGDLKTYGMGIEYRGGFSTSFDKKSYTVELRNADGSSNTKPLLGLRDDDDWVMDALFNEPLRIRDYISHDLWLSFGRVTDLSADAVAPGMRRQYCEVFENGSYRGLYYLGERLDRKQLDIQRVGQSASGGELLKGAVWDNATTWQSESTYDDDSDEWSGWELKYPDIDDEVFSWRSMAEILALITEADDATFAEEVSQHLDIDNMIDYYLLMNMLMAEDNTGKNIYMGKARSDTPYFFLPWDMDGVMGRDWTGNKTGSPISRIITPPVFERLLEMPSYRASLKQRWQDLKDTALSNETIKQQISATFSFLKESNVYEREAIRDDLTFKYSDSEEQFLHDWLDQRHTVVDQYISSL